LRKKTAKEFDAVATMLEIRDRLSRHAEGLTSEEKKRIAQERDAQKKGRQPPDKAFQAACMRKRRAGKRSAAKTPRR
jgi:hypothetical protein